MTPKSALTHQEIAARAAAAYNAASDSYDAPSAWWSLVMGSGYRGTVDQLTPDARARVREQNLAYATEKGVSQIEANVIYAIARKP